MNNYEKRLLAMFKKGTMATGSDIDTGERVTGYIKFAGNVVMPFSGIKFLVCIKPDDMDKYELIDSNDIVCRPETVAPLNVENI